MSAVARLQRFIAASGGVPDWDEDAPATLEQMAARELAAALARAQDAGLGADDLVRLARAEVGQFRRLEVVP